MAGHFGELVIMGLRVHGPCDICQQVTLLEWDHDNNEWVGENNEYLEDAFRGWLCRSCNARLGYWEPRGLADASDIAIFIMMREMGTGRRIKDKDWFEPAREYLQCPPGQWYPANFRKRRPFG